MIHLRSTSIQAFLRCREEFRQHYLMRRVGAHAEIHRELGAAVHKAVEMFWSEEPFEAAMKRAIDGFSSIAGQVSTADQRRYAELKEIIPDMVACYFDSVEYSPQLMLEKEWSMIAPWNPDIVLSGRIDRVAGSPGLIAEQPGGSGESLGSSPKGPVQSSNGQSAAGPIKITDASVASPRVSTGEVTHYDPVPEHKGEIAVRESREPEGAVAASGEFRDVQTRLDGRERPAITLTDLKTCSEIEGFDAFGKKVGWERSYHDQMVKDFGIALYDWYLRQVGMTPTEIQLECLMKPYARYGKKARLLYIPLPEVIAYRDRFDQQLEMITQEIYWYVKRFSETAPWPMTGSACSGKYGNCYLLAVCNYGISKQTEKLYSTRDLGVYEISS